MGHDVGYVVWTPADYDASGETRYPGIYFLHGKAKVELALARGKHEYDRRHDIAKRDEERDMARALAQRDR